MTRFDEMVAGFGLDRAAAEALARYLHLLLGWRRGNVTAVRTRAEAVDRLLVDSLALLDVPALGSAGPRWLDLGAGAGIPGIPLAVARQAVRLALLDSAARKCVFLEAAVTATGLADRATVVHARSEEFAARAAGTDEPAGAGRGAFDVVFARAVAGLATVVELAAPLLAAGGALLAVKTAAGAKSEGPGALETAERCGLVASGTVPLTRSPVRDSVCVVFVKREPTPEWLPRRTGLAAKRPLTS